MKLSSVEVADALCGLIRCRHGNKSIAPSTRTAGIGHHFGPDNLPILVEEVLQIGGSSGGRQSTDPQVPAGIAAGATCFFVFNDWLYIFFFLKRARDKSECYSHGKKTKEN